MLYHWVELHCLRSVFSAARVPVHEVSYCYITESGHVIILGHVMFHYWVGLCYIIGLNLIY